jgi:hypothetical protein
MAPGPANNSLNRDFVSRFSGITGLSERFCEKLAESGGATHETTSIPVATGEAAGAGVGRRRDANIDAFAEKFQGGKKLGPNWFRKFLMRIGKGSLEKKSATVRV